MGYAYHFVALDEEQNTRRRHLLDSYGRFANLSILLIPLIYQLSYAVWVLLGRAVRNTPHQPAKEHQSPVVASFQKFPTPLSSKLWARLRWVLNDEIIEGWGTVQEWLIVGSWATWLLMLAIRDTGDDYLHLTKRFGIIAASQLPLHYALALKSWSPIQYLTRMSHEELNPYHRLLGRVIITFFSLHASMYLNFYVQKGLLLKRIQDWDVILGLTAISTALLLDTTALAKIRDWNYRVFFYSHVILSISLLPTLYLHVSHLRIYILEAGLIYVLLILQRNFSQASANSTITQLPHTNLLSITIPLTKSLSSKTYKSGQHIYLGFPSLPQKLRINPFSIANPSPNSDRKIHLVARKLNGTTSLLADLATNSDSKTPPSRSSTPLFIEGPYGSAAHFPDLANFDRALFVAGGVGATFTLPLFIDLMQRQRKGENIPSTKFVWTVRERADAVWGLQMLREYLGENSLPGVELYVTGAGHRSSGARHDDGEEIELQERQHLMSGVDESDAINSVATMNGRPNLRALVDQIFTISANEKVAVLVCGPRGMGKGVRREVGRWVLGKGRDVFWHGEEFGW